MFVHSNIVKWRHMGWLNHTKVEVVVTMVAEYTLDHPDQKNVAFKLAARFSLPGADEVFLQMF